jgi:hypothetical protein
MFSTSHKERFTVFILLIEEPIILMHVDTEQVDGTTRRVQRADTYRTEQTISST